LQSLRCFRQPPPSIVAALLFQVSTETPGRSFLHLQPELDQASRPPNIAGFRPSIAGAADFVNKSIASLEAVRRNAGVLQRSDVQKYIRAAGVILDKAETALNIPHL
jgi:hypothetical protein